jgi:hypothetical protein
LRQCAKEASRYATRSSSGRRRYEPPGRNYGTYSGNCHQAEPCQQADDTTCGTADASACFGSFYPIVASIVASVHNIVAAWRSIARCRSFRRIPVLGLFDTMLISL